MYDVSRLSPAHPAYVRETRDVAGLRVRVAVGAAAAQELLPEILVGAHQAVDIETCGLGADRWSIKGVGIGSADGMVVAILDPRSETDAALIRDTLDRCREIHVHNASFDVPVLVRAGLLSEKALDHLWCTLTIGRMANPGGDNSLEGCAARLLGLTKSPPPWQGLPGRWTKNRWYKEMDLGNPLYLDGLAADVSVTARLSQPLVREMRALYSRAPFWAADPAQVQQLRRRETNIMRWAVGRAAEGFAADLSFADEFEDRYSSEIQLREARLDAVEIEPSKPATMAAWLTTSDLVGTGWPRTPGGQLSTDKKVLKPFVKRSQIIADYLTVRNAKKMIGYLETIRSDVAATGRVHPTINVGAARTGRMSISAPALQQFPPAARGILLGTFEAGLASIDWSSVEVVVAAALGRDADLLRAIRDGLDPYTLAMRAADIERDLAKIVILAGLYGQQPASLGKVLGITENAARDLQHRVFSSMPGVQGLMSRMATEARCGYMATMSGRVIPVPTRWDGKPKTYVGTNYLVQGSAYDLMADALAEIIRRGLGSRVFLAVHDEVVCDANKEVTDEVSEIMSLVPPRLAEHVGSLPVTLHAEPESLGTRWGKPGKPFDLKLLDAEDITALNDDEEIA